jgi:hypothetical protein
MVNMNLTCCTKVPQNVQAHVKRLVHNLVAKSQARGKGGLGSSALHKLDRPEETSAPDVAYILQWTNLLLQESLKNLAHPCHVAEEVFIANDALNLERCGASYRMRLEKVNN